MLWRSPSPARHPAGFVEPCLPTLGQAVPSGPQWVHEIKHDGFRFICRREGNRIRVFSRRGHDWTDRVPRIVDTLARLPATSVTLDGEGVACDPNGVTNFELLRAALGRSAKREVFLYAFDLLELDGRDMRREPWSDRRWRLARLLRGAGHGVQLSDHMGGSDGDAMFRHACAMGSKPGTVAALVAAYFASIAFNDLAKNTQQVRRNILERFRAEHGGKRVVMLQQQHIANMVAAKAATPSAARSFLNTMRALMQFAIEVHFRTDDPTQGVRRPRIKSDGFYTWSEQDITRFEAVHPVGSRARLAMALLLYTAQRRSDVVGMGPQHIRGGVLFVRQQKTGVSLSIPVHTQLQTIIDATPVNGLAFLMTAAGRPFTAGGFSNWFREMCNQAGLPKGTSAHGLRKAACRRLAEAGCSANVIAAISGHKSLQEIQRYTMAADQVRMAHAGIDAMQSSDRTKNTKLQT